jgi:dTDP-4-amino-4,6-dideoxygalactose transaminase
MPKVYLSPPELSSADHKAVAAALESNWVAPVGPDLGHFEKAICERVHRAHGVALNSGTAALHLSLQLLDVGAGDIVLCPSFTFAASANPICYCGAKPIFIGSEAETWNMDPKALRQAFEALAAKGEKPKAVIVVQLYGQCAAMDPIIEICDTYNVPLIEDAAEALGASYQGRPAGSFGRFSFISFNGNKIITTSGGGMLLGDDQGEAERALYLATQAREPVAHYEHKSVGYNYRLSNVLAALGRSQLLSLDEKIKHRRSHFEAYQLGLGHLPGVEFMPILDKDAVNYWLTCLTVDSADKKEAILSRLEAGGIEARPLWKPLHLQPIYKNCPYFGEYIEDRIFNKGLVLPSGSSLTEEARTLIIEIVRSCLA